MCIWKFPYIPPQSEGIVLQQESVICFSPQVSMTSAGEIDYSDLEFE